jgi:hypothetical protein
MGPVGHELFLGFGVRERYRPSPAERWARAGVAPLAAMRAGRLHAYTGGWPRGNGVGTTEQCRPPLPSAYSPHRDSARGTAGGACASSPLVRRSASLGGGPTAELAPLGGPRELCRRGAGGLRRSMPESPRL